MQSEAVANLHLRALFQHYSSIDCWCGNDFRGVVASYLLDEPEQDWFDHDEFPVLAQALTMAPEQRRVGLCEDIDRLLQSTRDEAERRRTIAAMDDKDVLEFVDFWMPELGSECPFPATLFLLLTQTYAKESVNERTFPYDHAAAHAMLEAAEREAARITDPTP